MTTHCWRKPWTHDINSMLKKIYVLFYLIKAFKRGVVNNLRKYSLLQFLDYAEFLTMTTFLKGVQMKWIKKSQRRFPVDTIKNSLRKASRFTQSESIGKRNDMNITGIHSIVKFSDITQHVAKTIKDNLCILSANHKTKFHSFES